MADLWSQPLQDWRRRFAEQDTSLRHLLLQWPSDGWGWQFITDPREYFDKLGMPWHTPPRPWPQREVMQLPLDGQSRSVPVLMWTHEVSLLAWQRGYREGEPFREYVYYGHDQGEAGRFQEMASGVAHCLTAMPPMLIRLLPDVERFLPIQDGRGPNLVQLWELLVHRLAWVKYQSSPLHARRWTWSRAGDEHGIGYLDFDEEEWRWRVASTPGLIDEYDGKFPPRHFCSVLPANIFQCSAQAIGIILSLGSPDESKPARPPTLFGTADYVMDETRATAQPQGAPMKPRKKRDQGKKRMALGAYVTHLMRMKNGETTDSPPTPTELARQVGCSVGMASRAIKEVKEKYMAINKEDASDRYGSYTEDDVDDE